MKKTKKSEDALAAKTILIKQLDKIGRKYNCQLYLPPSPNGLNLFMDITKIQRSQNKLNKFMSAISSIGYGYIIQDVNKKTIIEIIGV